jgi:hypothetical protein
VPEEAAGRDQLEAAVNDDLSLPHAEGEPRIHVPMLSASQGPGFATLLGLGLTARRIPGSHHQADEHGR